jgi:cytochrome c peroxidase
MAHPSPFRASRLLARVLLASALAYLLSACAPVESIGSAEEVEELSEKADELLASLSAFSLHPLSQEPVPQPIGGHIVNQAAAIRLGKAFFWDTQVGSDGQTACASCHFAAGADDRRTNTLHPGLDGIFSSGGVTGPGQTFTPAIITSDDRIGSQGMHRALFQSISSDPMVASEQCRLLPAPPFNTERQVGFRHTPSVIGAVFYRDQFWGGEGNNIFNGLNNWGFTGNNTEGSITRVLNASLASQAVGPPRNFTEMSCYGRNLNGPNSLATKLLARPPLQFQRVAVDDSVLGPLANPSGSGLRCGNAPCTYGMLIREAFGDEIAGRAGSVFSMVWGEALLAYEATLVPDQTPFDSFLAGNLHALTPPQRRGLRQFVGKGGCINCHTGAMLTDATVGVYESAGPLNRDGGDQGFHNIGVRPSQEDPARGDLGIIGGVPNSESGSPFDLGAFKTPTLRNVKLTAPYFHTGGYPTLADVVDFYARGGDFTNPELSKDIKPLSLNRNDREALVDFLANALTDCRVEKQRAPFDHPELPIPNRAPLPAVGAGGLGPCP